MFDVDAQISTSRATAGPATGSWSGWPCEAARKMAP